MCSTCTGIQQAHTATAKVCGIEGARASWTQQHAAFIPPLIHVSCSWWYAESIDLTPSILAGCLG